MGDEKPSSLVTSYHYLRYILLGFFLFVSDRFIVLCSSQCSFDTIHSTYARILLSVIYPLIGITLLLADTRNYVLYKLLYHRFYEANPADIEKPIRNLTILISLLRNRGIYEGLKDSTVKRIEALDAKLKKNPRKYLCKLRLNWLMFWAVQPGPVSLCIMFLYTACIILVSLCGLFLRH